MDKTFVDECLELGAFRKAYIKKHNLKVLGMGEACKLWREHQGDVDAKDTRIKELEAMNAGYYGTIESMKQTNAALIKKLQPDHIPDVSNMVSCDICGDCHELDNVPFGCQTGGEE